MEATASPRPRTEALDHIVESFADGERLARYPDGAVLIAADLPDFGAEIARALRDRAPIVVFYPDGQERVIRPRPWAELGAKMRVGRAFRAIRRRPH